MENWWSKFKLNFIVWAIYVLIWLIFLTCKKKYPNQKLPEKGSVVLFWHGRLSFMCFLYHCLWDNEKKSGKVIISNHKDGEIITRVISKFGIKTIRGSKSKGGATALISALKDIKNGIDIIITPDGPRGPRHSVADGAIVIAQKTDSLIYALNYEASEFWELSSWDKMIIPKPFSTINFTLSNSLSVKDMSSVEAKEKIQELLWKESACNGGKSIDEHKRDFVVNLKQWWQKNAHKNPDIDESLKRKIG